LRSETAQTLASEAARQSWGRLLALLASRTGDIMAAEDHLAEAFARALARWPTDGIPANPDGWLLTVARNLHRDEVRSRARRPTDPVENALSDMRDPLPDPDDIPDERLKLMFACAHPAIDEGVRTPLMLQVVLGLDSDAIGKAFLIAPATMAQRLVRAKQKIKLAAIPFVVPDRSDLPQRLDAVLEAIYAVYAVHWQDTPESTPADEESLGREAVYLAELLAELAPDEPEVLGLAALLGFLQSREPARRSRTGAFVPLESQECSLWNASAISRAEFFLQKARQKGDIGRFQIEAAIQSVHAHRHASGRTDWNAIAFLYEALLKVAPTVGNATALAAALGRAQGPAAGLACLDAFAQQIGNAFQPAWATRAHLLRAAGRNDEASMAFDRAIALTNNSAVVDYLVRQRDTPSSR
jgi:RNA polymerase sigma-70 factor (ECF subfamily)